MGKINNNLITEKALRPTRVNEALKKFFKAHGGTSTILYPRTIPEHIAYTSSITGPSENSPNGYVKVSRRVLKDTPGKGARTYTTSMFDKNVNRYVANALNKATGGKLFRENRKTAPYDQNLPGHDNLLKKYQNTEKGNDYLIKRNAKNSDPSFNKRLGSLVRGGINGVIANLGTLGSMPLPGDPQKNRDRLRVEYGQDELSSIDTVVPMNSQGTIYLDPKLGIVDTEVVEDHEGGRYYRNAQTGQFEPLDYNPKYKYYSPLPRVKKVYPTDSYGIPYLNDILGGVLSMPMSTTPLPIPPMHYDSDANKPLPPMSADEDEIPSGTVVVGPDTEVPAQPVQTLQSAQPVNKPNVASVVRQRRAPKPGVVNNTPAASVTPVSIPTPNVAAPTLSSVASQAVRHNGGFDNYRRESVLSALRAAGGISPAEAVQRGIIPWETLNYV